MGVISDEIHSGRFLRLLCNWDWFYFPVEFVATCLVFCANAALFDDFWNSLPHVRNYLCRFDSF